MVLVCRLLCRKHLDALWGPDCCNETNVVVIHMFHAMIFMGPFYTFTQQSFLTFSPLSRLQVTSFSPLYDNEGSKEMSDYHCKRGSITLSIFFGQS